MTIRLRNLYQKKNINKYNKLVAYDRQEWRNPSITVLTGVECRPPIVSDINMLARRSASNRRADQQGDLETSIGAFVERYNHHRYHESLGNLKPADVYFGRDRAIIERRRKIKKQTFEKRRLAHQRQAA